MPLLTPLRKPLFYSTSINWSHPLAKGLTGGWLLKAGHVGSLAAGQLSPDIAWSQNNLAYAASGVSDSVISGRLGVRFPSGHLTKSGVTSIMKPTAEASIFWQGCVKGNGTLGNNPALSSLYYTNTNTSPFVAYGIHRVNGATGSVFLLWNNGSPQSITAAGVIDTANYGTVFNIGGSIRSGSQIIYKNGLSVGSKTIAGTISYGATPTFFIDGSVAASGNDADSFAEVVWTWNRYLSANEQWLLSKNPFCFLVHKKVQAKSFLSQTLDASMSQFSASLSEATGYNQTLNAEMALFAATLETGGSAYSETLNAAMAEFAGTLASPSSLFVTLDQNMPLFNATLRATVVPPAPTHCEAVPVQSSAVPLAFLIEPDERAGS